MEKKNYTGIVPEQHEGTIIDTEDSIEFQSKEEAKAFFDVAKTRLLNVNGWHDIAGTLTATFQLVDSRGNEVARPAQEGDYFKIDIPGPGPQSGDGFDWVKVEAVEEVSEPEVESIGVRVRPAPSPNNTEEDVAHFYSKESTSNFIITREGNKVTASVYDRNTKPNADAHNLADKIRDAAVGAGAVTVFSKLQWKSLVDGLLKK